MGLLAKIWAYRSTIILLLTPIVFLPLPILYTPKAGRCAYGIIIMAVYWMTEVMPMAATALLPVVIMPWLGVLGSKDICVCYLKDTNMLFFGGLLVAVAVEKWNLHRRIALRVLTLVGSQPKWLMFGFMTTTAFLSMWMSNTATTAMMVPIVHAVLSELRHHLCPPDDLDEEEESAGFIDNEDEKKSLQDDVSKSINSCHLAGEHEETTSTENVQVIKEGKPRKENAAKKFDNLSKGMALCVAFAANIGGTATITGSPPNLVLKGQLDTVLFSCFYKNKEVQNESANAVIRKEFEKLGQWSFAEIAVLGHFVVLALLWLTRQPEFVPGWAEIGIFEEGFITDACVAITVAMSLFMFPSRLPNYFRCGRSNAYSVSESATEDSPAPTEHGPAPALLDWKTVHEKMSWSVLFLLGGGFALAEASKKSGLSAVIGEAFISFQHYPPWLLVLTICTITLIVTQITSNTATATIFLPVLAELSITIGIHPLYLMVPVTITTSLAFMLPVSTPPNAIVFAYCNIRIIDMAKAGLAMNIICLLMLQFAINAWGIPFFKLNSLPPWLPSTELTNITAAVNMTDVSALNTTLSTTIV